MKKLKKTTISFGGLLFSFLLNYNSATAAPKPEELIESGIPADASEKTLPQVLEILQGNFNEGYRKQTDGLNLDHDDGRVRFIMEKVGGAEPRAIISFRESGRDVDQIDFSQVEDVFAVNGRNGSPYNHVIIKLKPKYTLEGLTATSEKVGFDLLTKSSPELLSGYFKAIIEEKYHYVAQDLSKPEVMVHITPEQTRALCKGDTSVVPDNYSIAVLKPITFDECRYQFSEKMPVGAEDFASQLQKEMTEPKDAILLLCGSADELPANRCGLPKGEGNFLLSSYRDSQTAEYLSREGIIDNKDLTTILYPLGTELNERSVRGFYITAKKGSK